MSLITHNYSNGSGEYSQLRSEVYIIAVPVLIVICALAIAINLTVLLAIWLIRQPLSSALWLTASLTTADAWAALLLAVGLYLNSYAAFFFEIPAYPWACIGLIIEGLRLASLLTAVLNLLVLAIGHYSATVVPTASRRNSGQSQRNLYVVIALFWLGPMLGYFTFFTLTPGEAFRSENCRSNQWTYSYSFRLSVLIVMLAPLLGMISLYIRMVISLLRVDNQLYGRKGIGCVFLKRKLRTITTALLMIVTFLIGWLPPTLVFFLICPTCIYPYTEFSEKQPRLFIGIAIVTNLLIILKSLVNPLIYGIRIPEIRKVYQSGWRKLMQYSSDNNNKMLPMGLYGKTSKPRRDSRVEVDQLISDAPEIHVVT